MQRFRIYSSGRMVGGSRWTGESTSSNSRSRSSITFLQPWYQPHPPRTFSHHRCISTQPPTAPATNPPNLPLKGITVVTLEQAIAAPFCTRQLADLGARVIKVERPVTGDFARAYDARANGLSSHFVWTNRSKESLAVDVKSVRGREVLHRLVASADVVVQNLIPGAAARLGLGYEELSGRDPRVIVCDISGYGLDGPYSAKKAYDLLIQSEAGLLSVTGTGKEPVKVGISIADISAAMYAYSNILAALLMREKTGRGTKIDISMLEGMAEWMSFPLYYSFGGAEPPKPVGASHAAIYPYGPFETGDGSVMLGIQNEREWVKFCRVVLEDEGLAGDERFRSNSLRVENRDELRRIICEKFSRSGSAEVIAKLDEASIANAAVNTMHQLWQHPQLTARNRWSEVETSNGMIPALLPPGIAPFESMEGGLGTRMDKIPELGEHNASILKELGLDEDFLDIRQEDGK